MEREGDEDKITFIRRRHRQSLHQLTINSLRVFTVDELVDKLLDDSSRSEPVRVHMYDLRYVFDVLEKKRRKSIKTD